MGCSARLKYICIAKSEWILRAQSEQKTVLAGAMEKSRGLCVEIRVQKQTFDCETFRQVDANFAADDVSGEKSLPRPIEVNVESHDLCYWLSIGELQSKSNCNRSTLVADK